MLLVLCMVLSTFNVVFALESAVGSGSNNPYIISSKDKFLDFAEKVNSSTDGLEGEYYLLTVDIDLGGADWTANSIGSESVPFKGHFDGNGHTIKNYKLSYSNTRSYYGLFNVIGGTATIKNLGIENATYSSSSWSKSFGGLVGYMIDSTEIIGCFTKNTNIDTTINDTLSYGGGLVGLIESDFAYVSNSYATGTIANTDHIDYDGGLIGGAVKVGGISKCYSDTYLARVGDRYPEAVEKCYYVADAPWPYAAGSWGNGIYPGTQVTADELKAVPEDIKDVYEKSDNGGFPCFLWENYTNSLNGLGSIDNPYLIKTVEDLKIMKDYGDAAHLNFRLENDLDLGGETWTDDIGSIDAPFKGVFDGNGHSISNYKMLLDDIPRGIFAVVGGSGEIRNLGVSNVVFEHEWFRREAGGIVGRLTDNATVSSCYAKNMSATRITDNADETYAVGGLIGCINSSGASLLNSYAYNCDFANSMVDHDGGLVGVVEAYNVISNCYTNTNTMRFKPSSDSGVTNVLYLGTDQWPWRWDGSNTGYIGETINESELKNCHTRLGSAFTKDPVEELINGGYPVLAWETGDLDSTAFSGDGTELNPYIISSPQHIQYVRDMNITKNKHFKLTADIDMLGEDITSYIGTSSKPFEGIFDGNGYTISNYNITTIIGSDVGLFGVIGGNAKITNLGIKNVYIYSDKWVNQVGGLAGRLTDNAVIDGCFAKNVTIKAATTNGDISSGGGLIGCVSSANAAVRNSYALDTVANGAEVDYEGGFIGKITEAATIENCYSNTSFLRCDNALSYNISNSYALNFSSWAATGQAYMGTSITESSLKSTGASKLGAAFTSDIEPLQNNGFPILTWEVTSYLLGTGTVNDPYLVKTANDLKLVAGYTNSENLYFKLTDDIDIKNKKWVTTIGTDNNFFKGYFDGNGKVISNFKIELTDGSSYGLFGSIAGNAHIYNLGVENVTITTTAKVGTVGGMVGSIYDNAKLTGCFAKNVSFSGSNNSITNGGGLIGRIYASGAEIKSCYALGTSGLSSVVNDGGFAGIADLFAFFEDCYSDTTLMRYKNGLTIENCYHAVAPSETTAGYTWGDIVKNVQELGYEWSNDFVPGLYSAPSLKWEKYTGYYVNMIPNSAMDTTDPDSLFKTTGAEVINGAYLGRNSEILKMPRTTTFKYDLNMVKDGCYRVSFIAKTQGGVEKTAMSLYLGGINLSEQFVNDKITNDWSKKVIYVKPEKTGINRLAIGGTSAIYLDNVEVELVNQSAELAEISETLVHNQPDANEPITSFEVMTEICDGVEVVYSSTNDYLDQNGNITEKVPVGDGAVETDYTATVNVADKSYSKTVTLSLAMASDLTIDSIQLLNGDVETDNIADATSVGKVKVTIAPAKEVDLIVALYTGDKLVSMKKLTVSTTGEYDFSMDATDCDNVKVFMFEKGTIMPLLPTL